MEKQVVFDLIDEMVAASRATGYYQGLLETSRLNAEDRSSYTLLKEIGTSQFGYLRDKLYVALGLMEEVLEPEAM